MIIYTIKNKINNKLYIGQTKCSFNRRISQHINSLKNNSHANTYLQSSVNKHGLDNFEYSIIDYATSKKELNEKEKFWIAYYNSTDTQYGYNLKFGGEGGGIWTDEARKKQSIIMSKKPGHVRSEETRKKMSDAKKGKALSEEHRKKLSEAGKRKIFTEEHKENMRNKTVSIETRKKISEAVKRHHLIKQGII